MAGKEVYYDRKKTIVADRGRKNSGSFALIDKELIAFDGLLFQVLSLPEKPVSSVSWPLQSEVEVDMRSWDPTTIDQMIERAFGDKR